MLVPAILYKDENLLDIKTRYDLFNKDFHNRYNKGGVNNSIKY